MATLDRSTNVCKDCSNELPIDLFYRHKNRHGKRYASNRCKGCQIAKNNLARRDPSRLEAARLWRREYKRKLRREQGCRLRSRVVRKQKAVLPPKARQLDAHIKHWRGVVRAREAYRLKAQDPAYLAMVAERKRNRLASQPELKAKANLYMKAWLKTDKGRALAKRSKARLLRTPKGRLDKLMSKYMRECLGNTKNGKSWKQIVGYGSAELMSHLERQFVNGMGWHNRHAWHIDHRKPRASFRYSSPDDEEFKACWALSNLQPLWAIDNIRKGARLDVLM